MSQFNPYGTGFGGAAVPPQWASQPGSSGGRTIAVVALVTSVVALLVAGGIGLTLLVGGAAAAFGPVDDGEYTLLGSAVGVVPGRPYPGDALEVELRRQLDNDWSTVQSLRCPETAVVEADADTVCEGVIDDLDTVVTVTFSDDEGHAVFVQEW